jgi:hypothetical protein
MYNTQYTIEYEREYVAKKNHTYRLDEETIEQINQIVELHHLSSATEAVSQAIQHYASRSIPHAWCTRGDEEVSIWRQESLQEFPENYLGMPAEVYDGLPDATKKQLLAGTANPETVLVMMLLSYHRSHPEIGPSLEEIYREQYKTNNND